MMAQISTASITELTAAHLKITCNACMSVSGRGAYELAAMINRWQSNDCKTLLTGSNRWSRDNDNVGNGGGVTRGKQVCVIPSIQGN